MAAPGRHPADPVVAHLARNLGRTDFYQAVRLMLARPGGGAWEPDSRIRFGAELSHAFPGHELSGLELERAAAEAATSDKPARCRVRTPNYCVAGGLGPLPEAYTEWLREQARSGNPAAARFLDLFNHRLNVLRYRLKESRACGLNNLPPASSQLGTRLAALAGLDHAAPQLPARAWLGIAGHLSERRKSAAALTRVLARYLGTPVRLIPLVGAWRDIEADDRMALGTRNHALGTRSVLGERIWDQCARIRLRIGPLEHARFRRLLPPLPGQPADRLYLGLVALVRMLTGRRFDCEIHLDVRAETVGESVLTARPGPAAEASGERNDAGLRLGETAWLKQPRAGDAPHADYLIPAFDSAEAA